MNRKLLFILIASLLFVSCSIKEEKSAFATSQANFSIETTKTVQSFEDSVAGTQEAFSNLVKATQNALESKETELAQTNSMLQETATFQESVIATQQVIVQKEIEREETLKNAEEARSNPEVKGLDPIVDSIILSTNPSIGSENYVVQGYRYVVRAVKGTNLSSRNIFYEGQDTIGLSYIIMIASYDPSKIPGTYQPFVKNKVSSPWIEVIIDDQPYYHRSVNYGYGIEVASATKIVNDCYVVTFYRNDYAETPDSWINYLVDTNLILHTTEQPLCEGT